MGVNIEIYRLRIGSHQSITFGRQAKLRLKSKFWNQMLLFFYLKVFYLPCLKHLILRKQKRCEVCLQCVKIISRHVYLRLLLRLSNDVEENPGPKNINDVVDCTFTVRAEFNQGNQLRFGQNAGKQCVAMSLTSIALNEIKSVNIWDSQFMNKILDIGNSLYCIITHSVN